MLSLLTTVAIGNFCIACVKIFVQRLTWTGHASCVLLLWKYVAKVKHLACWNNKGMPTCLLPASFVSFSSPVVFFFNLHVWVWVIEGTPQPYTTCWLELLSLNSPAENTITSLYFSLFTWTDTVDLCASAECCARTHKYILMMPAKSLSTCHCAEHSGRSYFWNISRSTACLRAHHCGLHHVLPPVPGLWETLYCQPFPW